MQCDYISTYTNKKYYFLYPTLDDICIEDIAQALSMQCRYSGHVKSFYSVAEHSCLISDLVLSTTKDKGLAFSALMHDASEAYLTDIPRPIKQYLPEYKDMELVAEQIIQKKYNFEPMSEYIKYIDTHICGTEAKQLFFKHPEWVDDYDIIDIEVLSWSPDKAYSEFMKRFKELHDTTVN